MVTEAVSLHGLTQRRNGAKAKEGTSWLLTNETSD